MPAQSTQPAQPIHSAQSGESATLAESTLPEPTRPEPAKALDSLASAPVRSQETDAATASVVPRVSSQPIFTLVAEEHGAVRVHAFARRWRALRYQMERRRPWLAPHDLCAVSCAGLTSRCLRLMEREGFLCAIRPPLPPATDDT